MDENANSFELAESRDAIQLVPTWEPQLWWFFAGTAFLAAFLAAILLLLILLLRKKPKVDLRKEKREAYQEAKLAFGAKGSGDAREIAIQVSMILRRYLAKSMKEPALFETHEEFVARHDGLKDLPEGVRSEVGSFFTKLAAVKYAPDDIAAGEAQGTHAEGAALLERMHRA
jgi:hypothetical protein